MLLKECNRCKDLIPYGHTYCSKCEPIIKEMREKKKQEYKRKCNRRYNQKRDPKYIRFYRSMDWKRLSAKYMQDKGYRCEVCGKIATEVHHKIAIQTPEGWELRLDYNNLELVCTTCHNKRHNRFQKKDKNK